MSRPLLVLAGALSLLPSLAPGELARSLQGSSRLALAALPWLALAGLPPNPSSARERAPAARTWPADLGLALPILALGAWIDLRAGAAPATLATTGGGTLVLLALLAEARRGAEGRAAGAYALAWALLVAAGPALDAVLESAFGPAAFLARLSPLTWIWERVPWADPGAWTRLAAGPLPAAAALVAVAFAAAPVRGREAPR